jgi:hypothetical protein
VASKTGMTSPDHSELEINGGVMGRSVLGITVNRA